MAAFFSWDDPSLQEPEFRAMVNLLSMRNEGQMDSQAIGFDEEDDLDVIQGDDDMLSEAGSDCPGPIATPAHNELKCKFLDRFAEVLSRERHVSSNKSPTHSKRKQEKQQDVQGSFVGCAVLREHELEDRIELLVARNNGLDDKDQEFFREFEETFAALGVSRGMRSQF